MMRLRIRVTMILFSGSESYQIAAPESRINLLDKAHVLKKNIKDWKTRLYRMSRSKPKVYLRATGVKKKKRK